MTGGADGERGATFIIKSALLGCHLREPGSGVDGGTTPANEFQQLRCSRRVRGAATRIGNQSTRLGAEESHATFAVVTARNEPIDAVEQCGFDPCGGLGLSQLVEQEGCLF